MAKIYKHMNILQRKTFYFSQMIGELKDVKEDCEEKIEFYELLLKELDLCPKCHGQGQLREFFNQDEYKTVLCNTCGGDGKK